MEKARHVPSGEGCPSSKAQSALAPPFSPHLTSHQSPRHQFSLLNRLCLLAPFRIARLDNWRSLLASTPVQKLSLPHWPRTDLFTDAHLTVSSACLSAFAVYCDDRVHIQSHVLVNQLKKESPDL